MIPDIEIDLPLPVSTNALWRGKRRGVYRSPEYEAWIKTADRELLAQPQWRNKQLPARFSALMILNESKMRANQDIDNLGKCVLDYAKRIGLIIDDSIKYCREWHIKLGNDENAPLGARLILRGIE